MRHVVARNALPPELQAAIDGGIARTRCPRCDGGTEAESSLSIRYSDDGVVSFKCFRATCGWFGLTLIDPDAVYDFKKIKEANVYRKPTVPVQGDGRASLILDYGLNPATWTAHGWRMSEDGGELVLPILDQYCRERGHITRTLTTPKRVYTYKATCQPFLDWWFADHNTAPVVVVEDCLSACRLRGLGYNAVALLGTNLSQADAREIQEVSKLRDIYLALDRDAFGKAIKLRARHKHILDLAGVICLDEDIKNIPSDDTIRGLFS